MDEELPPTDPDEAWPNGAGDDESLLRALPGLARIGAVASWRTAQWAAHTYRRAGTRLVRAAARGEPPGELFQATAAELRAYARQLLEIVEPEAPPRGARAAPEDDETDAGTGSLRERGAELLRRSADVHWEESGHPAFARILTQLSPDEARILRLLARTGPQPSVDVRTSRPLGVGSQLVAPGLNMIGAEAGCRYPERVFAYLNNLYRLGLVWFSREPLEDPLRYQVLEAQPEVVEAMRRAGRGRTVRRTIHLTPFGQDFCDVCLP